MKKLNKCADVRISNVQMIILNPKNGIVILNSIEKQTISEKSRFRQSAHLKSAYLHIIPPHI
jgi:hypothetical protein